MDKIEIPDDVLNWLRAIFASGNERVTRQLSNIPNSPEEFLDMTMINHLREHSAPITFPSRWTVRLDTHYLGGLRHFGSWEIADIGLLLFFQRNGQTIRSKVGLLQSKRLYPKSGIVKEEDPVDYQIGMYRLADPENARVSLATSTKFEFDEDCRYGALVAQDEQYVAIDSYEKQNGIPVYYQFYNPWRLPFEQITPLGSFLTQMGELELGIRVVPSSAVREALDTRQRNFRPKLCELAPWFLRRSPVLGPYGWRLEDFISELFLKCHEGSLFDPSDPRSSEKIQALFNRRSGPISAAIAISIELPE